jgi:hypothetical protein
MSRQSPTISATKCNIGTIKLGNDKEKWIVLETKNNIKRWYKLIGNVKTYITDDNGAKPFKVIITDKSVIILKSTVLYESDKNLQEKMWNKEISFDPWTSCMTINKYKKIFIGKHSKKYGNPAEDAHIGNSILVELKPLTYLFIGHDIEQITTKEPIIKYISTMGRNLVPYPFALTENYTYLILGSHYLNRNDFGDIEPYSVYYNFDKKYSDVKHYKYKSKILVKGS